MEAFVKENVEMSSAIEETEDNDDEKDGIQSELPEIKSEIMDSEIKSEPIENEFIDENDNLEPDEDEIYNSDEEKHVVRQDFGNPIKESIGNKPEQAIKKLAVCKCEFCNKVCANENEYKEHLKVVHNCVATFSDTQDQSLEDQDISNDQDISKDQGLMYKCHICNHEFAHQYALQSHYLASHASHMHAGHWLADTR